MITLRMIMLTTTVTAATIIITTTRMLTRTDSALIPDDLPLTDAAALRRLMTWLSPSFPVGAFSYSSGIEWAVEDGDIHDAASLQHWLTALLTRGAGLCDGIFLAHAYRATIAGDLVALHDLGELAAAFVSGRERHLETTSQGRAFAEMALAAWDVEGLQPALAACGAPIAYPLAVGVVASAHRVPLEATMHAFLHAIVSNWISAGARLVPLGQTDSQRVLAALEPALANTAERALASELDDLASATFRADLGGMRHETQYTRLFRS